MSTRKGTIWGSETQSLIVSNSQSIIFSKNGAIRKRAETIWVSVTPPDPVKVLSLIRQLQELANNPNLQPVYIQWASGGGTLIIDPEDGWYTLENVTPNEDIAIDGIVPVQVTASYLNPGLASRALAVSYIGSPATIGWGGPAQNWLSYPLNATGVPFLVNRFGAEGYIPTSYALPMSALTPQIFAPSGTISDLFKGRVAVYDTVNTSAFPVLTGGNYTNAGWVEVLHPDHQFLGDCVITNVLLLLCQVGQKGITLYFWNINTNQWLAFGTLDGFDNNNSSSIFWILRGIVLGRISYSECSVALYLATSRNNWIKLVLRIIAGANFVRCLAYELTQTNATQQFLQLSSNTNPKVTYNDNLIRDNSLALEQNASLGTAFSSGFGYAAAFANSATFPCVFGWLYLNNTGQTNQGFAATNGIGVGDSSNLPAINQFRSYGFFIFPFSVPQNLQAEGESGVLGTGWSSGGNVNASAGNEAKAASGTVAGNADLFGTAFVPPPGAYDVWFHMRVTSGAGSQKEMTLGLWDTSIAAYVPGGFSTFSANQIPSGYTSNATNWVKANITTPIVPTPGHRMQFRAVTTLTLGTDWFVDEAVLVPVDMLPSFNSITGPHAIWSEFALDRRTRVIPLG
jgi:hypothetical protein